MVLEDRSSMIIEGCATLSWTLCGACALAGLIALVSLLVAGDVDCFANPDIRYMSVQVSMMQK